MRAVLCAVDVTFGARLDESAGGATSDPLLGEVAEALLRAADAEARRLDTALALLHALPVDAGVPMSPGAVEQALVARERLTRTIVDRLSDAAGRLIGRPAAELAVIVEDGPADEAIVRAAERLPAELVVLGSTGARGRWRPRFLGSVATAVVQRAPCSVLVVRRRG
jgi:nucleotide-binding universal stress UspA family protein